MKNEINPGTVVTLKANIVQETEKGSVRKEMLSDEKYRPHIKRIANEGDNARVIQTTVSFAEIQLLSGPNKEEFLVRKEWLKLASPEEVEDIVI